MYFHFQFNGVLKKNYNSVDLTEVELPDDTNGFRKLSPEIEEVCLYLLMRKIIYPTEYVLHNSFIPLFHVRSNKINLFIFYGFPFYIWKTQWKALSERENKLCVGKWKTSCLVWVHENHCLSLLCSCTTLQPCSNWDPCCVIWTSDW